MLDLSTILDVLTTILLGVGGFLLFLFKTGAETTIKTSAAEGTKAALQQLQWPIQLARELQKTRGIERQELRFASYGQLWKALRPLAIYDATVINREIVSRLSLSLSDWYFSAEGGLLLTPQARNFYFALQDLLRATSRSSEDWEANRADESEGAQKDLFHDLLVSRGNDPAIDETRNVLEYFITGAFESWQDEAPELGRKWRTGMNQIAADWDELDERERFAALQQAGSILRTSLVNDLESRLA